MKILLIPILFINKMVEILYLLNVLFLCHFAMFLLKIHLMAIKIIIEHKSYIKIYIVIILIVFQLNRYIIFDLSS